MPLISMKVPDEVLAKIDAEAESRGMSRTALLLLPWKIGFHVASPRMQAEGFASTLATASFVTTVAALASRPAHAIDCKCLMCKPSKPERSSS